MKSLSNTSTNRFASALYELAEEESQLDRVEAEVRKLKEILKDSDDFKSMTLDPTLSKNEQTSSILKIAELYNFSELFKKFLSFLISKRRLFYISKIIDNFVNLTSIKKGIVEAKLSSAKELSAQDLDKIQKDLSENYGSKINLTYTFDPSLLGGMIVQVGSIMIDSSLKTKLNKLQNKMLEV